MTMTALGDLRAEDTPDATIDVVIVAYRSAATIRACISAARRVEHLGTVTVIDHGYDGSGAIAQGMGAMVVFDATNPGFGAGQNRGRAQSSAQYLLILNPDAEPLPTAIADGMRYLDEHVDVAAVQGLVLDRQTMQPDRSQGRELGVLHLVGRALGASPASCRRSETTSTAS